MEGVTAVVFYVTLIAAGAGSAWWATRRTGEMAAGDIRQGLQRSLSAHNQETRRVKRDADRALDGE
jgi:hypothetical protein